MNDFLKNQMNAFFVLVGGLLISVLLWYYVIHQGVQSSYKISKDQHTKITRERSQYRGMKNGLPAIEAEWKSLNTTFENVLERIPYKRSYDHVSNTLFDLLLSKGLNIISYLPSDVPIEKKTIKVPDSDQTILIEKYPIDVEMTGNFIQLGKFMDALKSMPYRITASNIHIKKGKKNQDIKLIAYVYLQSGKKKIKKSNPVKKPKISQAKTENSSVQNQGAKILNKEIKKLAEPKPVPTDFPVNKALICEEIDFETNRPILPGESFPIAIGRLYCFTTVVNKSGQNGTVSHNWYLNDELIYKVFINVNKEGSTDVISNLDFNLDHTGQWKVIILDQDKNVLETILFELV